RPTAGLRRRIEPADGRRVGGRTTRGTSGPRQRDDWADARAYRAGRASRQPGSARGAVQEEVGAVGEADDGAALVAQMLVDVPVQLRQDLVADRLAGGDDVAAGTGEVDQLGRGAGVLPAHHTALEQREVAGHGWGEVIALDIAGVHDPRV